jgi:hypothetical protein
LHSKLLLVQLKIKYFDSVKWKMGGSARSKRKKSNSPEPAKAPKSKVLKKTATPILKPTKASSSPQVSTPVEPTSSQSMQQQSSQASDLGKPVKPIFISANIQVIKNVLHSSQLSCQPLCKVRNSNSTQVSCFSSDDKKMLISKLQSHQIGYHTFTDPSDKPVYYLLKGFYHATSDEMLQILQNSGVPAKRITDFIRNKDYVMYLVHFDKPINVNFLNHSHKHIDGIVVKWEALKKKNKKVTQCFRCQQWGHSSMNCGLAPRCVKCSDTHEKGACPRTNREGDPKCCNCGGPHSSNHRGCPTYQQHLEKIKARTRHKPSVPASRGQFNVNSSVQFPRLGGEVATAPALSSISNNNVSYARTLNEPSNGSNFFTKLSQAQSKLKSLPNIDETVDIFVRMVDELYACSDQMSRQLVLIKYCTTMSFSDDES